MDVVERQYLVGCDDWMVVSHVRQIRDAMIDDGILYKRDAGWLTQIVSQGGLRVLWDPAVSRVCGFFSVEAIDEEEGKVAALGLAYWPNGIDFEGDLLWANMLREMYAQRFAKVYLCINKSNQSVKRRLEHFNNDHFFVPATVNNPSLRAALLVNPHREVWCWDITRAVAGEHYLGRRDHR